MRPGRVAPSQQPLQVPLLFQLPLLLLVQLPFFQSVAKADLISVNHKVGLKLDDDERDKYALFEKENNFLYAVFIQLKDGTRTLNIVYNNGSTKTVLLTDEQFSAFHQHIEDED